MSDEKRELQSVIAQVSVEAWVICPDCEESWDLRNDIDDYDDVVTKKIFSNEWKGLNLETKCPACGTKLIVEDLIT